jgi:hypothetical protein
VRQAYAPQRWDQRYHAITEGGPVGLAWAVFATRSCDTVALSDAPRAGSQPAMRRYRLNKATACSGATSLVCHQWRPRKHVILGSCLPAADPVAHDITSRPRRGGIPPTATASTGDKYLGDRLDPQWVGDDHRATNGDNARTTAGLNMDGKDVSPSYERWHWQPVLTPVLPEMSIPDPARTNVFNGGCAETSSKA